MYFSALPNYQRVPLSRLRFSRVLFGGFPSYPASPLKPAFDRVLQVCRHIILTSTLTQLRLSTNPQV